MCEDSNLMDQRVLTYLKVALWLADRSPELSHIPLLSVLSLVCLVVPFVFWLWVTVPCVLACLALAGGWLRGWLCLSVAAGLGLRLGLLPLPCFPLYASSSAAYLLLVCAGALPGWCASVPCGLGCVSPLSPLPCCLVALPHTVSLVWVRRPGLRGSGVRGVPWLPRVGCLDPGHE